MATLDDLLSVLQGASNSAASTVSAPVDGINWILKKAGFPVSDKPVGGSDWLRDKGLMADPKNQNMGYVGEAIGGVLPMVAAAKAPQIASALNQMGANMAAPRTLNPQTGAIVWHGSPHKFDKFDSSKIGTGEGAQAYGHGMYFAENPRVAEEYRQALGAGRGNTDADTMARILDLAKGDSKKAAEIARQRAQYANIPGGKEKLEAIAKQLETGFDPRGSLYKIDLPDEHIAKMLDWDKPLSQQPESVRKALEPLGYRYDAQAAGQYSDDLLGALFDDAPMPTGKAQPNPMGSEIARGKGIFDQPQDKVIAEKLRQAGIPGIRYLDGGSRGTGQGTSNFVVFPGNENLLRILERNGIPLD